MNRDNTLKFSDRVGDYIKFRPNYPDKIIDVLERKIGLTKEKIIADIGSGTGISSLPFLKNGNTVFGVEPNKEMREAQEVILKQYGHFFSVNGTAESTNLEENEIDVIFCGQVFHWFDKIKAKIEFNRILKDKGNIVLVWNSRSSKTEFQKNYEKLLFNNIQKYKNANHRNISDESFIAFFHPRVMETYELENEQKFDLDGLKGRLKSSSYCPKSGIEYKILMTKLDKLFYRYENKGEITFQYITKMYWC